MSTGRYARGLHREDLRKVTGLRFALNQGSIAAALTSLPTSVDLSAYQPAILNQGQTGSCTAHSVAAAIATALAVARRPLGWVPSPREIYAATRALERAARTPKGGKLDALTDSGAQLADVVSALGRYGIAPMGPSVEGRNSDVGPANCNAEPDAVALEVAGARIITGEYIATPDSDMIAAALAAGFPVWVGFFVDSAFEDLEAGDIAHAPNLSDPTGGGHAVYLSGYSGPRGSRVFTLTNSWGEGWCAAGKCLVSEAWLQATWSLYPMAVSVKEAA